MVKEYKKLILSQETLTMLTQHDGSTTIASDLSCGDTCLCGPSRVSACPECDTTA